MSSEDERAGNSVSVSRWSGFDQLRLTDDTNTVIVTIGSIDRWDRAHLRRLRQSADLPGLVPVIDSDFASDEKPFVVVPALDGAATLADRIPPTGSEWMVCASITESAARAAHEAHIRGLFHGSFSPDQIHVTDDDVAVSGIGLGLGGNFGGEYAAWVAPEVLEGNDATERSDVFSLGKILEASLGGSMENVPRSIRRLIMWSSSDTPEARPPSALEFASILAEALGEDRPTFNPAFIPTVEATDLASTASAAVAAFDPSVRADGTAIGAATAGGASAMGSTPTGTATAVGAAAAGTAAAAAMSSVDGNGNGDGDGDGFDVVDGESSTGSGQDTTGSDDPAIVEADAGDMASSGASSKGSGASAEVEVDDSAHDATDVVDIAELDDVAGESSEAEVDLGDDAVDETVKNDAVQTNEIPLDVADDTNDDESPDHADDDLTAVGEAAVDTSDVEETAASFASSSASDAAKDNDEFDVPAARQTDDLEKELQPQGRGAAASIMIGVLLALGLGLVLFALAQSDDGEPTEAASDQTESTDDVDSSTDAADSASDAADGDAASASAADDGAASESTADEEAAADNSTAGDSTATGDDTATDDTDSNTSDDTATDNTATDDTDNNTNDNTETDNTATDDTGSNTSDDTATDDDSAETATAVEPAAPAATVDGPISASEAGVQLLHGIPGVTADVYVDGEALAPGFTAGTIAGPADLPPGSYEVAIYASTGSAPEAENERTDEPLLTQVMTIGSEPSTLVAHLDGDGEPALASFVEPLENVDPGTGRVEVRHLAAADGVTASIDGEDSGGILNPGESTTLVLDAGEHQFETFAADGATVASATLTVADGELASISLIGVADDNTVEAVVQRFSGLATAPVDDSGIPAGDSNLLAAGDDPTGLYLVGALSVLMALAGGLLMLRRSRRLL